MDAKKWPVLGQILIGLGAISGLINIFAGVAGKNIIGIVLGVVAFIFYWSFYKMHKWAYIGVNILLSLGILVSLLSIGKIPVAVLIIAVIYPALVLFYFNSKKIRALFDKMPAADNPTPQS
jgi:hypothetical protein